MFSGLQTACASLSAACRISLNRVGTRLDGRLSSFTSFLASFIIARHDFLAHFWQTERGSCALRVTAAVTSRWYSLWHVGQHRDDTQSIESTLEAIVLADPMVLQLDDVNVDDEMVVLTVTSTQAEARCPVCGQPSARIHSSYVRHPSDLALAGHRVRLHLNVRRFFCANPTCERGPLPNACQTC